MLKILILFNFVIISNLVSCNLDPNEMERNIERCMRSCATPKADIYSPVCASDGKTYTTRYLVMCRDACSMPYGRGLQVVYEGPCSDNHGQSGKNSHNNRYT